MATPMMSNPDLVEILAHLDYIVAGPKTRSLQDSNTEEQMDKILVELSDILLNRYSKEQLRERLWQEFRHGYTYPEYNFPLLFLHGSCEVKTIDSETTSLIKERLRKIHLHMAKHMPRSRRSKSIPPASMVMSRRNPRNSSTPAQPSKRSNAGNLSKIVNKTNTSRKKKSSSKAGNRDKPVSRYHTTQPSDSSIKTSENSFHLSNASSSTKNVATPGPLSNRAPVRRLTPTSSSPEINEINTIAPRNARATNSPCITTSSPESSAQLVFELTHYKKRWEEAEQECNKLKKEMRQMESFYTLTKGIPENMFKELRHKTRQNINLRKRLDDRLDLEPHFSIRTALGETPTTQRLCSSFQHMKVQLASILVTNDTEKLLIDSLYGISANLDALLCIIFDADIQKGTEKLSNASPVTLCELIQALTGAAIHRWVFEKGYRSNTMTITPLLQRYRDLIRNLAGHETLCDLDTTAHQSLIREKDFNEVIIPRMTSEYTTLLLDALQPLFSKSLQSKTREGLKSPLDCIFGLAMQIRSLSLVGTEEYESVWPSSGSLFDNNEMETEQSESNNAANLVRLPLLPGIRAYSKQKAMVGYHGFGNGEGPNKTPKYVCKALVLI
ncbi:uncharacterized protein K460DRAFT_324282 [Cucurbitaria berberidis CBS 394.84]|uniref:Uncharacterized protein n=1 Tax=Cucurbitaria berberidis CBS 394.84 TaxID=1168544 RepID=A0A9P4GRD9_9PLEO|nr:uncharacterized protein K460DRAFT_324282 [Cucurbitaria berberidis CBS 394.84]KAF1849716.1 hypothetical protein K460DRAFT_324282 [Cucurbitaria berberidis CBS 394.84]